MIENLEQAVANSNGLATTALTSVPRAQAAPIPALAAFDQLASFLREHAETGCFEFSGSRDAYGYGKLTVNGKRWAAHRLMYSLLHGPLPQRGDRDDGRWMILHKCDNPPCCNPNHLYLGSAADNAKDMANRCRVRRGYWKKHGRETQRGYGTVFWKIGTETKSLHEWAEHFKIHPLTLDRRLSVGWPRLTLGLPPRQGIRTLAGRETYERISGDPVYLAKAGSAAVLQREAGHHG